MAMDDYFGNLPIIDYLDTRNKSVFSQQNHLKRPENNHYNHDCHRYLKYAEIANTKQCNNRKE